MHLLTNEAPIVAHYGKVLPPGTWLMTNRDAFQVALMAEGGVRVSDWVWATPPERLGFVPRGSTNFEEKPPSTILVIRPGAIGDLLLLSPALAALRAKWPDAQISLAIHDKHEPVAQDFGVKLISHPTQSHFADAFDLVISLEDVIENNTTLHATDAFAKAMGVTVESYKPLYFVAPEESGYPHYLDHPKRIGIHLQASSPIRDYPMDQWQEVMKTLHERGWEIMLLGNRTKLKNPPKGIVDCSGMSFREAAAVLATCNVFCGVDSSFFNLCPALGVPAIGLFGPVNWRTRVREGNGQFALHGQGCEPCGWTNSKFGRRFPENMPCNKAGACVLLADISPARIVAKIEKHAL
jgi:ADP-heptose:LPS heptosyltransferase